MEKGIDWEFLILAVVMFILISWNKIVGTFGAKGLIILIGILCLTYLGEKLISGYLEIKKRELKLKFPESTD